LAIYVSRIFGQCIYAESDNSNKFNESVSWLLGQMYLQLSKSGQRERALALS
jgi:hypothetical protein